MPFFKKPLAGPGYIILNLIRAMNITALLAVIVASFAMLVKTFIVSKFFFFDAVSHVITAALSMFLILTETPLFRSYFARAWPLLSPSHGFLTLAFLMIVVGVSILGNLNKEATSQSSLGTSYWRIVIASGILCVVLGVVNIVANFVFRQKKAGVTARMVRAYGAVAGHKLPLPVTANSPNSGLRAFQLGRSDTVPTSGGRSYGVSDPRRNISAPVNDVRPGQFGRFEECEEVGLGKPEMTHPAMRGMGERF